MKVLQIIKKAALGLMLVAGLALPVALQTGSVADAASTNVKNQVCSGVTGAGSPQTCGDKNQLGKFIQSAVNILLFVIGAVAVVMVVIGGIRYVTSGGDQSQVTGAKNTILYAVVGIVVAAMAYAIVNFVIGGLFS